MKIYSFKKIQNYPFEKIFQRFLKACDIQNISIKGNKRESHGLRDPIANLIIQ